MSRRHPVQREKDLEEIAHRYLMLHEPQAVIAAALNVCQKTISKDIKVLIGRWQASALMDVDVAKSEELARINRLELEYWNAWEASKRDKESTVAEKVTGSDTRIKAVKRAEGQVGNPTFLAGVQWCIERRCRILGIDAPTKVAPTDPTGTKEYEGLTDEQRLARLGAILDAARARRDREADGSKPGMDASSPQSTTAGVSQ